MKKHILSLALCFVLLVSAAPAGAAAQRGRGYQEDAALFYGSGSIPVSLPHALVQGLGVMSGDQDGNLNWDKTLTRAEAATMLVRLVGGEDEAQMLKGTASAFSDVPEWATGYVNYAYGHKLVQGVGEGLFGPDRICTAPEFLTMLYRLTDLTEGTDYTWSTAVDDFLSDVTATPFYNPAYQHLNLTVAYGPALKAEAFTRELAASTLFRMMNIVAGADDISLADKLANEYGLSSTVLYDCSVRRTAWKMGNDATYSITMGPLGSVPFSLKDGKLYMDGPAGVELEFFVDSEVNDRQTISVGKPFTLPKEKKCQLTLSYYEEAVSTYHSGFLFLEWADGQPAFTLYENGATPDYSLYYAVQENGFHLRAQAEAKKWTTTTNPLAAELRTLTEKLTAGKSTQRDKAQAICTWVATHIFYDYDDYLDNISSKENILVSRRGVCSGYASLTEALMEAAGLECYTETSRSHAWNAAYLDGAWVLIDNTWDSPLKYRHGVYMLSDSSKPARTDATESDLRYSYPVSDKLEPGATSQDKYFGMADWTFYQKPDHIPERAPELYGQ